MTLRTLYIKLFVSSILITIFVTACVKQESALTANPVEVVDTSSVGLISKGSFVNGPYGSVNGMARLYKKAGKYQLALDSFLSSNGPDLKVYLSKETNPMNFFNLSSLKSTTGSQVYNVPDGVDVESYLYTLIYCKQYSHLFGFAELKK